MRPAFSFLLVASSVLAAVPVAGADRLVGRRVTGRRLTGQRLVASGACPPTLAHRAIADAYRDQYEAMREPILERLQERYPGADSVAAVETEPGTVRILVSLGGRRFALSGTALDWARNGAALTHTVSVRPRYRGLGLNPLLLARALIANPGATRMEDRLVDTNAAAFTVALSTGETDAEKLTALVHRYEDDSAFAPAIDHDVHARFERASLTGTAFRRRVVAAFGATPYGRSLARFGFEALRFLRIVPSSHGGFELRVEVDRGPANGQPLKLESALAR